MKKVVPQQIQQSRLSQLPGQRQNGRGGAGRSAWLRSKLSVAQDKLLPARRASNPGGLPSKPELVLAQTVKIHIPASQFKLDSPQGHFKLNP